MSNVTLIDNYDSFTFNLVHYFGQLGANVTVHRNDSVSVSDVIQSAPDAIVLSPGPCTPHEAGICMDLIRSASETIPIFGVCLGHQSIGEVFGGDVVRAPLPIHGKMATIHHTGATVFRGIDGPFQATRYHSLVVKRETLPDCLQITAQTPDDLIMALSHKTRPVHGVQFHPESITSQHGHKILRNFLDLADEWNGAHRGRTKVA
ncbi:MAG: anthranilate synthase component II [Methylocystis sp.]|jgi:anthranilate synthase component II|nr:aminodeoxychorismate/anthranilate synthase component II [Alphaproteobacteria bacterium]NBT22037.1 aminodeoxychorismate/anthranilate synthase component II [Methylocystaceae bacterium]NBV94014.1 aminodeoxychorismate/anthranilate synthase component II [Methylocystaceae bacterium]